jgi:coproporphyrinogen III oxidase-like Fe-S oxidoreductase
MAGLQKAWSSNPEGGCDVHVPPVAENLLKAAKAVKQRWEELHSTLFRPLSLNVEFAYFCDLECPYCYTRKIAGPTNRENGLNRRAIEAAARLVAGNCAAAGVPFQLVLQGLGEPTLLWEDLQWCVDSTRNIASKSNIGWSGHLTTSAQFDEAEAESIGRSFTHVTISCDGPPELHDANRPRKDGNLSSARLAKNVGILVDTGIQIEARVTVTPANAERLPTVVDYIAGSLGISLIRLETVYGSGPLTEQLPAPEMLLEQYFLAEETGADLGAEINYSGIRLTEIHGEYCEASRQALRLAPDGSAINCMRGTDPVRERAGMLGCYDADEDKFVIDQEAVEKARAAVAAIPAPCVECLNIYHCARTCPDSCPDRMQYRHHRCPWHQGLSEAWILGTLGSDEDEKEQSRFAATERAFQAEVEVIPDKAAREAVLEEALAPLSHYDLEEHIMPAPACIEHRSSRPEQEDVEELLALARERTGAISVYVHIPFCRRRCVFCDCHSVAIGKKGDQNNSLYVKLLLEDLETFCNIGGMCDRPVTTIHFGGGTPDSIGYELLTELAEEIRKRLNVSPTTEWAIETNLHGCCPQGIDRLIKTGFSRLHAGVQTLDDSLRTKLGRKTSSKEVIDRLLSAMTKGMVVSVDMLYGLPDQVLTDLLRDINFLIEKGVHGVSLYRLNISSRNRKAMHKRFPSFHREPLKDYLSLTAAENILLSAGYRKNHYVHYALEPDKDLYFRHAVRGEDLLAIGASATGMIGDRGYLCDYYPDYVSRDGKLSPFASIVPDALTNQSGELAKALMAGVVLQETIADTQVSDLVNRWKEAHLLAPKNGGCRLTAPGSWFIGKMLRELAFTE